MAEVDSEVEAFYHRKMDRSPEKQEFHRLPPTDKILIGQLRGAMEGAREKVTQLRDEIDDKDRDISRETALRKAAEERLDQLVDMYGDPAVMEELKERLPRARKTDPKVTWQNELDQLRKNEEDAKERSPNGKGEREKREDSSDPLRRSHSPPGSGSYPGFPPYSGYYPPGPPGYYPTPPHMYPMPPPQVVYMSAPGAQGATGPGGPFLAQPVQNQFSAQAANQNAGTDSAQRATGNDVRGNVGLSQSSPDVHAAAAAAAKDNVVNREQNRQISLLLAELDAARNLNKKLQARLAGTQQELDSVKITQKTREAALQKEASDKLSDLVEEIYRAQKERDEAMMGRLRIANEERDEAMLKLRKMQTSLNDSEIPEHDVGPDVNLKELLSGLDDLDSDEKFDQQGRNLVDAINRLKQRKRQITTEEMKAVLEARDSAVAKCKKQEGELLRLQRQVRGRTPEKQQQATIQAKLLATQQERDMALNKIRKMEEELQTLRVYYSLHKSLSQEANLRDQFNNTLENYEGQLKHRDSIMDQAQKENNKLVAQLKASLSDKSAVDAELMKVRNQLQHSQDKSQKLEKVVGLLRERVKEMPPPIDD